MRRALPGVRSRSGTLLVPTLAFLVGTLLAGPAPGQDPPTPELPAGAARVIDLLRAAPDDEVRLEAVLRWSDAHGGPAPLADALAERGRATSDALDLSLAGTLFEAAGRPDRAVGAFEEALPLAATNERVAVSRLRAQLAALWVRAGWVERAAEVVDDPADLDLATALRLVAAGVLDDDGATLARWRADPRPVAERIALARDAGLPALAATLAEEHGELSTALALRIEAGELAAARALLDRGADASAEERLALARGLGEPALLEDAIAGREDAGAADLRNALERSLGRAPRPATPDDPDETSTSDVDPDAPRPPTDDPRRAAAEAVLAGDDPEAHRAALGADGPPFLAVAAARLAAGETEGARREVALWRLAPRPGEESFRASLERAHPEWFGGTESGAAVLRALERTPSDAPFDRARLDRALLANDPGSEEEAALLFHRGRLSGDETDLARAAAIAPDLLVREPRPAGTRVRPIRAGTLVSETEAYEPVGPIDAPRGVLDGAIVRLGNRQLPPSEEWHLRGWREVTDPPPPVAPVENLASHPVAPVTGWLTSENAGTLVLGRGVAWHDRDGRLVEAIVTGEPVTHFALALEAFPEEWYPTIARFLGTCIDAPVDLGGHPAVLGTWEGIVRRQALERDARPSFVRAEGSTLVIRGGGIRAEFSTDAPADTPPPPFAWFDRDGDTWVRTRPPSLDPPPSPAPPPAATLVLVERAKVDPAREARPTVPTRMPEAPARSLRSAPETFSPEIVTQAPGLHGFAGSDGWIAGEALDASGPVTLWWTRIEPPLPGRGGWTLSRAADPVRGRRGPDLADPGSDAGCLRLVALGEDRIAVTTDRVVVLDRDGRRPDPRGPAGGVFDAIRDVTETTEGVWVLPAPGDRIAGPARTIPLGHSGGYDLESTGDALWVLGYDPVSVRSRLERVDLSGGGAAHDDDLDESARPRSRTVDLPEEAWVEEDRAHQRPLALGTWGDTLLLVARGQVWALEGDAWRPLLPERAMTPILPAHARQAAPRVVGERLVVAWPWGEVEEWRTP